MRQTNFFQAPEDERELLELILGTAPPGRTVLLLDTSVARVPDEVRVYRSAGEVPPVGSGGEHEVLHAALLGGHLEVTYRQVAGSGARGSSPGVRIDPAVSPVFEYQRCSQLGNQLLRGRVYAFDRDLVPAGEGLATFAKGQELSDWFNSITRWIRARYLHTDPPGPFLVGPHAAAWHRRGGQLAECGFHYRLADAGPGSPAL